MWQLHPFLAFFSYVALCGHGDLIPVLASHTQLESGCVGNACAYSLIHYCQWLTLFGCVLAVVPLCTVIPFPVVAVAAAPAAPPLLLPFLAHCRAVSTGVSRGVLQTSPLRRTVATPYWRHPHRCCTGRD
jgi:hypothetical protein